MKNVDAIKGEANTCVGCVVGRTEVEFEQRSFWKKEKSNVLLKFPSEASLRLTFFKSMFVLIFKEKGREKER